MKLVTRVLRNNRLEPALFYLIVFYITCNQKIKKAARQQYVILKFNLDNPERVEHG